MGTPGLIGHDQRNGGSHRSSRLDRVRPGESLIAFPVMAAGAWTLLVTVFAALSRVFGPDDERGTWGEVAGAALGNFVMVFGLTFAVSLVLRFAGHGRTATRRSATTQSRRVARGAVIGALPGLAIAVVPLLLHQFGAISSDQSQIGFVGLPILIVGTLVGAVVAAPGSEGTAVAVLGGIAGFAVGLAAGASVAVVTGVPGVWLALVPLGMIIGATFATYLRGRRLDRSAR